MQSALDSIFDSKSGVALDFIFAQIQSFWHQMEKLDQKIKF